MMTLTLRWVAAAALVFGIAFPAGAETTRSATAVTRTIHHRHKYAHRRSTGTHHQARAHHHRHGSRATHSKPAPAPVQ